MEGMRQRWVKESFTTFFELRGPTFIKFVAEIVSAAARSGVALHYNMPIAYDPAAPFSSIYTKHIARTIFHPMYLCTIACFIVIRLMVAFGMTAEGAKQIDTVLACKGRVMHVLCLRIACVLIPYLRIDTVLADPATLVGTLFSFLIGFFVNNCFTRFMDNWRAAMIGWSRLNDLALQVYGYVSDRTQACEVLRLMNAANHLCYGDLAGSDMVDICVRRHLLTVEEARRLRRAGGAPPFYVCSCWALAKLADPKAPKPVDRMLVHAMDKSVVEWRQQTTLLPMIQMNPLPFPYYRNSELCTPCGRARGGGGGGGASLPAARLTFFAPVPRCSFVPCATLQTPLGCPVLTPVNDRTL